MMTIQKDKGSNHTVRYSTEVAVLITALIVLGAYLLLRYGGRWGETDAGTNSQAIQAMFETGKLLNDKFVYPNGYGYQALAIFIMNLGGISTSQFQLYIQVLFMSWIVLPAWLLYRELTGTGRGATLATAILLVQPEFLFFLFRGTHEKFTRGLILLALYLFVKSLAKTQSSMRMAGSLIAFYLVVYGFIAFNNLLSFSMISALLLALVLLTALRWWTRTSSPARPAAERRLGYTLLSAGILVFLFTFYFYTPARNNLLVLNNMLDRTASLVLDIASSANYSLGANPYAYTSGAWLSTPVYFVLSISNWLLLFSSAAIWLWQSLILLRRRAQGWNSGQFILWALFGAFAIQEALSIVVDFSGSLSANLQVRAFPAFVIMAAPLVARTLIVSDLFKSSSQKALWTTSAVFFSLLAILATLKSTNEPLISNKWAFYIPAEMQALDRGEIILRDQTIWTESDERLLGARLLLYPFWKENKDLVAWMNYSRNILVSDITRARGMRTFAAPPIEADSLIVYDNGQAQIYHLRPGTPFQP